WIARLTVIAAVVFVGATKFSNDPRSEWVRLFEQIGLGAVVPLLHRVRAGWRRAADADAADDRGGRVSAGVHDDRRDDRRRDGDARGRLRAVAGDSAGDRGGDVVRGGVRRCRQAVVSSGLRTPRVPIVQRPRTWPFQGQNTGSNPVGDVTISCSPRSSGSAATSTRS